MNGADTFGNTGLTVSGAIPTPPNSGNTTRPESPPRVNDVLQGNINLVSPVLPSASLTEKFFFTAADPAPGSRDERLKRVIRMKYEAGLLKPYNFVKGYSRLLRWMDCKYVIVLLAKAFADAMNLQRVARVKAADLATAISLATQIPCTLCIKEIVE
jgi:hypothetical protein